MFFAPRRLTPLPDRGPLRAMFVITSMPVGGAETLLVNLMRRLDRQRLVAELCCLKTAGPLGRLLADEFPVHCDLLRGKYDLRVLGRLRHLLRQRRSDAVITVGAGDKMFWGRLAGWCEGLPVILSALHSTGWPDTIGRLNRALTPLTDAFIAVAQRHGRYLVEQEGFPARKVRVIPNGVDLQRFCPGDAPRATIRRRLGLPPRAPLVGLVAALWTEKNHLLFLRAARVLHAAQPEVHFAIVGDGPERAKLEQAARAAQLDACVHFLGSRDDIPDVLAALDVFTLTSHSEANPVSILEAMASGLPVVATDVGSVSESVLPGRTGFLAAAGDAAGLAASWQQLLEQPALAHRLGASGRERVAQNWSLEGMVDGYQDLIAEIYERKCGSRPSAAAAGPAAEACVERPA